MPQISEKIKPEKSIRKIEESKKNDQKSNVVPKATKPVNLSNSSPQASITSSESIKGSKKLSSNAAQSSSVKKENASQSAKSLVHKDGPNSSRTLLTEPSIAISERIVGNVDWSVSGEASLISVSTSQSYYSAESRVSERRLSLKDIINTSGTAERTSVSVKSKDSELQVDSELPAVRRRMTDKAGNLIQRRLSFLKPNASIEFESSRGSVATKVELSHTSVLEENQSDFANQMATLTKEYEKKPPSEDFKKLILKIFRQYRLSYRIWLCSKIRQRLLLLHVNHTFSKQVEQLKDSLTKDARNRISALVALNEQDRTLDVIEEIDRLVRVVCPDFDKMSQKERHQLCRIMSFQQLYPDTVILWEERMVEGFYILLSGTVEFFKVNGQAKLPLAIMKAGDMFGHARINIPNATRSACCVTITESSLLVIPRGN